jgi:hypothetical protein
MVPLASAGVFEGGIGAEPEATQTQVSLVTAC